MQCEKVTIKIDLGRYKYVDLSLEDALKLLYAILNGHGRTRDLEETIRFLENFDEFHTMMRKKFRDYITPPKDQRDLLYGRVVVDKVKLYVSNNKRRVIIVFDKRYDTNDLISVIKNNICSNVEVIDEI